MPEGSIGRAYYDFVHREGLSAGLNCLEEGLDLKIGRNERLGDRLRYS